MRAVDQVGGCEEPFSGSYSPNNSTRSSPWRISKLSSGMRQKVSIVRTIIHDPEVVVFDEPTVGLDVITAKNIIELIRKCKDEGKTVIFSTHIMGEVNLLSDDMALIHKGRLIYDGTFKDFLSQMKGESLEEEFIRLIQEVRT